MGLGPSALAPLWDELDEAILRHDLGAAAARVVEAKKQARLKVTASLQAYFEAGSPPYEVGSAVDAAIVPSPTVIVIALFADGTASVDGTKVASDDMVDPLLVRRAIRARLEPEILSGPPR